MWTFCSTVMRNHKDLWLCKALYLLSDICDCRGITNIENQCRPKWIAWQKTSEGNLMARRMWEAEAALICTYFRTAHPSGRFVITWLVERQQYRKTVLFRVKQQNVIEKNLFSLELARRAMTYIKPQFFTQLFRIQLATCYLGSTDIQAIYLSSNLKF